MLSVLCLHHGALRQINEGLGLPYLQLRLQALTLLEQLPDIYCLLLLLKPSLGCWFLCGLSCLSVHLSYSNNSNP